MKRVLKSYIIAFYFNYAVATYRWSKKVFTSLYFYGLLIAIVVLVSLTEVQKNYSVTGPIEKWKEVMYVMEKSEAPEPIKKRAIDFVKPQAFPDTVKHKK